MVHSPNLILIPCSRLLTTLDASHSTMLCLLLIHHWQSSKRGRNNQSAKDDGKSSISSSSSIASSQSDASNDLSNQSKRPKPEQDVVLPPPALPSPISSLPIELISHIFSYSKRHLPLRLVSHRFDDGIQHLHQNPEFDCKSCRCTTEMSQLLVKRIRMPWLSHWGIKGHAAAASLLSFSSHLMKLDNNSLTDAIDALRKSHIKDLDVHIDDSNAVEMLESLSSAEHYSNVRTCSFHAPLAGQIEHDCHHYLSSMTQLTSLTVKNWVLADEFTVSSFLPHLPNLRSLELTNCGFDDNDLESMSKMPNLSSLTSLVLASSVIRDPSFLPPFLQTVPNLKHLDLSDNDHLQPNCFVSLFSSQNMCNLESLDLRDHCVSDEEFLAIRTSPYTSKLKKLIMNDSSISPRSLLDFFFSLSPSGTGGKNASPLSLSLQELSIKFTTETFASELKRVFIDSCSANEIAALKPSRLRRLSIQFASNTNAAITVLSALPVFSNLRELCISDVDEDGIAALVSPLTSYFKNLTALCVIFGPLPFTWRGLQILSSSPLVKELRFLEVGVHDEEENRPPQIHVDDKWAEILASSSSPSFFLSNLRVMSVEKHHMSLSAGLLPILSKLHTILPHLHYLALKSILTESGDPIPDEDAAADRIASPEQTAAAIMHCLRTSASNLETLLLPMSPLSDQVQSLLAPQLRPGFLTEKIQLPFS